MKSPTLSILLVFCSGLIFAQPVLNFEKIRADGLTNDYIKCIQQDKSGYLWFGTEEGLFRYDGYNFLALKNLPGDSLSIANNNIEYLYPEEDGSLWVGSRGGLSWINTRNLSIRNFPAGQTFTVYSLVPANDNNFYVGTSTGLYLFNKLSGLWTVVKSFPPNIFIRWICTDGKKNLYITSHSGLYRLGLTDNSCKHFDLPVISVLHSMTSQICHKAFLDERGILWISTWNLGLLKFDTKSEIFSASALSHKQDRSLEYFTSAYDLLPSPNECIFYANAENGLSVLDTKSGKYLRYPLGWDDLKDLPDRVYALFRDKSGILWIGTENGIYKNDPHNSRPAKIDLFLADEKEKGVSGLAPLSILCDNDSLWWIGTYQGIFLMNPADGMMKNISKQIGVLTPKPVTNIWKDDRGYIWLTIGNQLIKIRDAGKHESKPEYRTFSDPSITSVMYSVLLDSRKRLWIGTHSNGLFRFDFASGKFIHIHSDVIEAFNKNEIRVIYELNDSTILVGGDHTGLAQLNPVTGFFRNELILDSLANLRDFSVNALANDEEKNLWIGTEGNGLWKTKGNLEYLAHYTIRNGFPSMNITGITAARNGHIWLLTEGGVLDFNSHNSKTTIYDKESGIRNLYSLFAMTFSKAGDLLVGDMGCIHVFPENSKPTNAGRPEVLITGLKIFDQPFPIGDNKPIELSHDQNYFSFDYVALNYTHPARNHYAFKLEGLDENWHDAGTMRSVSYANLNEGEYTFKVRAANGDGVWNENPATIHFIIRAPFWHRWWFYLISMITVFAIAVLAYTINRNQLRAKEQIRNRIARDLHDDIGSTLSGINIFSKLALQKLGTDKEGSSQLLQKINERSAKTMEALSDIVWSINTSQGNMSQVLARMLEYLGEVAEPLNIQYEFIADPAVYGLQLDIETKKEVYLIFKEAVYNASKYSGCRSIKVEIRKENGIIMTVTDDGKGFDIKNIIPGNGINNMQERAAKIDAKIKITSEAGRGTEIRLLFPLT